MTTILARIDTADGPSDLVALAAAVDACPFAFWALDPDGRIRCANRHARAALGDGPGRAWRDCWPAGARFSVERALLAARGGESASFRTRIEWGCRGQVYAETTVTPIVGAGGAVTGLSAVMRDITAEWETAGFLNSVIQLLPMPLTVRDLQSGLYVLANAAGEELLGAAPDTLVGKTLDEAHPPARAEWIRQFDAQVLRSGMAKLRVASQFRSAQGRDRVLMTTRVATFDDDGPRYIITLSEDITEAEAVAASLRQALERAELAGRAKDAILAKVSHEIRTPLHGVVTGLDMLARQADCTLPQDLFALVRSSSLALEAKLQKALELVELDQGRLSLNPAPFQVDDLMGAVAASAAASAAAKGLDLAWSAGALAGASCCGDADRIRRILDQFLENAIKFTPSGGVRLSAEAGQGQVRFTVEDTGLGLDDGDHSHLFGRFHQEDDSLTGPRGGLGLGLALAHELAALMGGEIGCAARPGGGSTFWFSAPLAVTRRTEPPGGREPRAKPRILVADDHPTNLRLVQFMFDDLAEVTTVEDGAAALAAFRDHPFDLVLMDIKMPVMDGVTAVAEIRRVEADEHRPRTPIAMLTANTDPAHLEASRTAGADRHIGKPFTAELLLNSVRALIAEAQAPLNLP